MQTRMNTEAILGKLAEIRRGIPRLSQRRRPESTSLVDARTVEEFEAAAVVDAMETLAEDLRATIEDAEARAYESALDVYHAAEELARDPARAAEVLPHVESMRAAHRATYGIPIPTKEETERRRARDGRGRVELRSRRGRPGVRGSR